MHMFFTSLRYSSSSSCSEYVLEGEKAKRSPPPVQVLQDEMLLAKVFVHIAST